MSRQRTRGPVCTRNVREVARAFSADERERLKSFLRRHDGKACYECRNGRVERCEYVLDSVEAVVLERQLNGEPDLAETRYHSIDYLKMNYGGRR